MIHGTAVTGPVDTLVRVKGAFRGVRWLNKPQPGSGTVAFELIQELAADDQAVMFTDGWIAVAYSDPYRVEWYDPLLRIIGGAALPLDTVPVDDVQKRFVIRQAFPNAPTLFSPDDFPPWPALLPPFPVNALLTASDGTLVIRRTADAKRPGTRYDIVGRDGALAGTVQLNANERIGGFGLGSVYVIRRDDLNVETIYRHPWPVSK